MMTNNYLPHPSARFSPFGQQIWTFDAFREDVAGAGGVVYAVYRAGELYIYIFMWIFSGLPKFSVNLHVLFLLLYV